MSALPERSIAPVGSRWVGAFGAWGAMLGATFAALVVAFAVGAALPMPGSAVAWAAMLGVSLMGALIARPGFGERAGFLASLLALMALAPIAVAAADAFGSPLVTLRPRSGGPEAWVLGPVYFFASMLVAPFVAFPLSWRPWRALAAATRALAYVALGGAFALATAAAVRAIEKPSPDAWVSSLPLLATLGADPRSVASGDRVRLARRADGDCAFDVLLTESDKRTLDQVFTSGAVSSCGPVGVRRDDANGLWVFTDEAARKPVPILAVDARTHASVTPAVGDLARSLSAPPGWIALAFAGAAAGALGLAWGRRKIRKLGARLDAVEATHEGRGAVRLAADSPPFAVDLAADLPLGPVLLVGAAEAKKGGYRESGAPLAPREALHGTKEDARAALASAVASQHAFALVSAVLAAAPLVVAAREHLVF